MAAKTCLIGHALMNMSSDRELVLAVHVPEHTGCALQGTVRVRLSAQRAGASFSDDRGARGPAVGSTESSTSHIVITTPDLESSAPCLRATPPLDTWLRQVTRA